MPGPPPTQAKMSIEGKIGPIPMPKPGTLTAKDKQEIWDKTKCGASVRGRANLERSLTISGPLEKLKEAHTLAMKMIEDNKKLVAAGTALPAGGDDFKGSEDRKEAGLARKAAWETPKQVVPEQPQQPEQAHEASARDGRGNAASSAPAASNGHQWSWNGWCSVPTYWGHAAAWPGGHGQSAGAWQHPAAWQGPAHGAAWQQPAAAWLPLQTPPGKACLSVTPTAPTGKACLPVTEKAKSSSSSSTEKAKSSSSSSTSSSISPSPKKIPKNMPKTIAEDPPGEPKAKTTPRSEARRESEARDKSEASSREAKDESVNWEPSTSPERRQEEEEGPSSSEERPPLRRRRWVMLIPKHLVDREIKFVTVGCRDYCMEDILDSEKLPKSKCLLIDCRPFQGARANVQWHYGSSTRVITNIMAKDKHHLRNVFKKVCKALNEDHQIDTLIFFCDHGKHRSVGVADITSNAMKLATSAWTICGLVHLMKKYWSRKKCGWARCAECDQPNMLKDEVYRQAKEMFVYELKNPSTW